MEIGDAVFGIEEPETVATWTDGVTNPASVEATHTELIVSSTRENAPSGVEIEYLEFEWLGYVLGTDTDATWKPGRVQTQWGTFVIIIASSGDGGAAYVECVISDRRLIGSVHIATGDHDVRVTGSRLDYSWITQPSLSGRETASMLASPGFSAFLNQTPATVEVEVWEVERDVRVQVR